MVVMNRCLLLCMIISDIVYGDLTSMIDFRNDPTDFIPTNPTELRGTYSPIASKFDCALLCHQDPQCRTSVFDPPSCRLYESSADTGSIISSASSNSVVGVINYDNIQLTSTYNKSCDYCYPDRYLVCRNDRCQCPLNTVWNDQNKCINQLFVDATTSCKNDAWCRQDMNLTCQCKKCQCPSKTFWINKTCVPQFLRGTPCNTSDQCRIDLNLTCSRTNKTCTPMSFIQIPVINGTRPIQYSNLPLTFFWTGMEWYRAFDNNIYSYWNSNATGTDNYILVTFPDQYLLVSLQLTVYGDVTHDPQTIYAYLDEDATCLIQSFSFPTVTSLGVGNFYTFPPKSFNYTNRAIATNQVLLKIDRWSIFQVWLFELTFFGALY